MRCYCHYTRCHDFYVDESPNKGKPLVHSLGREHSRIGELCKDAYMYIRIRMQLIFVLTTAHTPEFVRPECQTKCGEHLGKERRKGKPGTHHLEMIRGCVRSCIHTPGSSHYDAINKCRVHCGSREEDSVTG
ncbi:unnamed protein product [Lasius platythorax]|uniref:Uncharacterized protein n=1 Tax=Lasius platythorax TaxID=488582 RepID=A0AAV2NSV4_9HYME